MLSMNGQIQYMKRPVMVFDCI